MIKKINLFLVVIGCFGGLYYSFDAIKNENIYRALIVLSIFLTMTIPYILNIFFHKKINDTVVFLYLSFVFCGHFLGSIVNLYNQIYCYDKIMHYTSGILTALLGFLLLIKFHKYSNNKKFNVIFIIAITGLIAVLWEVVEYSCDFIFAKDAQRVFLTGVNDTMQDMIVALLGSIMVSCLYVFEILSNKNWLITKYINNIKFYTK